MKAYLNFAAEIRSFLRAPVTFEEAKQTIINQVENREANFLRITKTHIFEYEPSPYLALFKAANITYTDVEHFLGKNSLEETLNILHDEGIYVTFEEIKGRTPIKRRGIEIEVEPEDFDSPNLTPFVFGRSGGSTGTPTRTKMDLAHVAQHAKHLMMGYKMYDVYHVPTAVWRGLLPDVSGVANVLRHAHMGHTMDRWFTPVRGLDTNMGWSYTILTYLMVLMARFHGHRFPFPQFAPLDDPMPIIEWAVDAVEREGACLIRSHVSKAVRISMVAQYNNISLQGVSFYGAGEPPTSAKIQAIHASGASYIPHFSFNEGGNIATPCGDPNEENDLHLMLNHMAVIQKPVEVMEQTVNALCLTSLLQSAPKMLLNAYSDDFGIIEKRECSCMLGEMGLKHHITKLRSYRKLTGEGVTLIGSDMVHILEEIMPAQFGGGPLDYQLVEEQQANSLTKLVLYVHPKLSIPNEDKLAEGFLTAMREGMPSSKLAQIEYRQGETISVRRQAPILTGRGKHFAIRTLALFEQEKEKE